MTTKTKTLTQQSSEPQLKLRENKLSLYRACQYTAQFWSDMLRLNLFKTTMQTFAQELGARTNPLNRKIIDRFQTTLEAYLYEELSRLDDSLGQGQDPKFERWVGCLEYGPNTYLADVAESFSISPLHFLPQTGCYVYPGRIVGLNGEARNLNAS
jgi:hypothetical protein